MALVSKTFSEIITFTRASTGTYTDNAGVLQTAAVDAPRFDYVPTTLAALGFLVEESRTNNLLYSEQFDNAVWVKGAAVVVTANTTVAPDGTTTGDTVTANSGVGVLQSTVSVIGTTYSQSIFVKAGTATAMMFRDDTGAGRHIVFNPSTGAITSTSGTLVTSGSQAFGNGWWRYWFTYVADTTAVRGNIRPDSAGLAQTFIVWGAQTETGAFPTSYISTTTATVTRAADVASINTLSPWYNATEGTIYAQVQLNGLSTTKVQNIALFSDGTVANRIGFFRSTGGQTSAVVFGASISGGAWSTTTTRKIALGIKSGDSVLVDSGTVAGTSSATTAQVVTNFRLGSNASADDGFTNGYLQRITYYPRRLTNTELQALTA